MKAVVAIYIDPDFYPPTISAILNLAERMDEVIVISRNNSAGDYPYPANVKLKKTGKFIAVRGMEKSSVASKVRGFLYFIFSLLKQSKKAGVGLIVLYDPFALLAYYLVKKVCHGKKIWYHNHDMISKTMQRKYSIGGLAARYESAAMKYIDFFSLPSKERLKYFAGINTSVAVFILPNYPSLKVYPLLREKKIPGKEITLIYQGFIGSGHSIEEIITLLNEKINGFSLRLILKGPVNAAYKKTLDELATQKKVLPKLQWMNIGPYCELPALTASCDIGIGINMNTDMVSQAQGTASNKIYEYAASGLPVILYDAAQFTAYLDKYSWAFFTDGSLPSLEKAIEEIIQKLPAYSASARHDFETALNFETHFIPALNQVIGSLATA